MNAAVSIVLLAAVLGVIVFLLSRRENTRRSQYGPAGLSEFRTDLPLDECFDRLDGRRAGLCQDCGTLLRGVRVLPQMARRPAGRSKCGGMDPVGRSEPDASF